MLIGIVLHSVFQSECPTLLQPFFEDSLGTFLRGKVVPSVFQTFRQTGHVGYFFFRIMGIYITFSIMQIIHQLCGGIADNQRDRLRKLCQSVLFGSFISPVQCVGTGRQRQVDHRLCQVQITLRHAVEMTCLIGGHGNLQGL